VRLRASRRLLPTRHELALVFVQAGRDRGCRRVPVKQLRVRAARSAQHQRVGGKAERCLNESGCHYGSRQLDLEIDWLMVMLSHVSPSSMKEVWISDAPEEVQMVLLRRANDNRLKRSPSVQMI
jgi:hypothetical protein